MGDSAHVLIHAAESGEPPFSSMVKELTSCGLCLYCVGQDGLGTSLKPEEVLIYLYNGHIMVGMSELGSVQATASLGASNCCFQRRLSIRPS